MQRPLNQLLLQLPCKGGECSQHLPMGRDYLKREKVKTLVIVIIGVIVDELV